MDQPRLTAQALNASAPYALPEELTAVRELADKLTYKENIVMIGAGPGVFALAMLERRKDPPLLYVVEKDTFHWITTHLEAAGCDLRLVKAVSGDSYDVGRAWELPVDFLIVDGDHTFEGAARDIKAWLPHVKSGCRMFFHDFYERPEGFNGSGVWGPAGVYKAVQGALVDGYLVAEKIVGISIVCIRTDKELS
jgi:hypothetical protein